MTMTRMIPRPDWTPEEFVEAVHLIVGHEPLRPGYKRNIPPAVLALFRPAEEPEPTPGRRCGMGQEWDNSACYRLARWQSVDGKAVACDKHRLPTDVPIQVGPAPAPAAPPPAGEPAWMTSELRKNLDCMVFVDAQVFSQARGNMSQVFSQARASMVAAIDHAVLSALAALRAENERLRQQLDPPTQSGSFGATTAKVAGNCTKCNGYIYHDPHHIGEYLHECVPPGENRSEG